VNDDRLPLLPENLWSPAQKKYAQEIIDGPRRALISPFIPLLRSPELMGHTQRLGEYLRYRSSIGLRLSELAILVTARHWNQQVEWAIHAPIALQQGLKPAAVEAIRTNLRPQELLADEQIVYAFCKELLETQNVQDATWESAIATFGDQGCIDLIGVIGYYAYLAMLMNAARTPPPSSSAALLQVRDNEIFGSELMLRDSCSETCI
jgi:4-carboxymuconolactone decarboxylase